MWWLFLDNPNNHHIDWNFKTPLKFNQTVTLFLSLPVLILLVMMTESRQKGNICSASAFALKGARQRWNAHLRHPLTSSPVPLSFSIPSCVPEGWHLPESKYVFSFAASQRWCWRKLPRKPVVCVCVCPFCVCVCVCLDVCGHPVNSLTRALKPRCRSNTWVTWSAHTQTH